MTTLRNTLAGWLLGIRITGPDLRALADKIDPVSPNREWAQGYDMGRTRGLLEGRGIGGGAIASADSATASYCSLISNPLPVTPGGSGLVRRG